MSEPLPPVRRISVTGNTGSGKSTLSKLLGEALGLDVYSLDSIVWHPGWIPTPVEERRKRETEIVERPSWIVDGVSGMARRAADTVVFLDLPFHGCLRRSMLRSIRYGFGSRPELPPGCPEWKVLPRIPRLAWGFHRNVRPTIISDFEQWEGRKNLFHIREPFEASQLVEKLLDLHERH